MQNSLTRLHASAIRAFCAAAVLLACICWSYAARAQTTVVEYIHTDALGSPVAVTNEAGQVIERTQWEPYGAAIGKPNYDGPGYTGHVMDGATGLTYMQQRYYDPQIGRFLSVDPVAAYGGDQRHFNRYSYAYNNPYMFTDPDGRQAVGAVRLAFTADVAVPEPSDAAWPKWAGWAVAFGVAAGIDYVMNESADSPDSSADADPNGPFTIDSKPRSSAGADGGRSEIETERDSEGRTTSTTHTVKDKDGNVTHGHTDHVGENGSRRRFSDELTGKKTVGEGKQEPKPKDRDPGFPREPVREKSRY